MPDTPANTTAPPAPGRPISAAPGNPRVPPDDKTIPGYENMSFEQRRFAQDQRASRERGR